MDATAPDESWTETFIVQQQSEAVCIINTIVTEQNLNITITVSDLSTWHATGRADMGNINCDLHDHHHFKYTTKKRAHYRLAKHIQQAIHNGAVSFEKDVQGHLQPWPPERLRITCSQDVEPREFSVWLPPTGTRVSPQPPLNYAQGTALQSKLGHLSQEFAHRVVELEKTEKQQAARITALERELVILEEVRRKEHQRLLQQHVSMMQQWLSSARTAAAAAPEGTAAAKEYKRLERKVQAVTAELAVCSQAAQDATNRRQELGIASLQLPAPGAVVLGSPNGDSLVFSPPMSQHSAGASGTVPATQPEVWAATQEGPEGFHIPAKRVQGKKRPGLGGLRAKRVHR